jgi:hypothetical protein
LTLFKKTLRPSSIFQDVHGASGSTNVPLRASVSVGLPPTIEKEIRRTWKSGIIWSTRKSMRITKRRGAATLGRTKINGNEKIPVATKPTKKLFWKTSVRTSVLRSVLKLTSNSELASWELLNYFGLQDQNLQISEF